jgi:hypothetical protein
MRSIVMNSIIIKNLHQSTLYNYVLMKDSAVLSQYTAHVYHDPIF